MTPEASRLEKLQKGSREDGAENWVIFVSIYGKFPMMAITEFLDAIYKLRGIGSPKDDCEPY